MKPIKKFSAILESDQSVLESLTKTHGAGLLDLVKKLGLLIIVVLSRVFIEHRLKLLHCRVFI